MTDLYSRACLGIIAISLASIAAMEATEFSTERLGKAAAPIVAAIADGACQNQQDLVDHLAALKTQVKNVPANVQERDAEGTVVNEHPNRLYEQLMLQIITVTAELDDLRMQCGA